MRAFRYVPSVRRLLLIIPLTGALLFGMAMLDPYLRQSLFGPKIDGVPWCVWEDAVRREAGHQDKSWLSWALQKAGLMQPARLSSVSDDASLKLLPVFVHLAQDPDVQIRRYCIGRLERRVLREEFRRWSPDEEQEILPVMRELLKDEDPLCQLGAAEYLWRAFGDREMIKTPLTYLSHPDPLVHRSALITLAYLAAADPEAAFDPLAKAAFDPSNRNDVRCQAVLSMRDLGERGTSVLRKALSHPSVEIRRHAVFALSLKGKDAAPMVPDLLAMQSDPDAHIRRSVARALSKIDGTRFPAPGEEQE